MGEVARLVEELEKEYAQAAWDSRNSFAHSTRRCISRVAVGSTYQYTRSPLKQECLAEDVVEPVKEKEWAEMEEEEYDGDYVASTDPMHPVSTEYTHPLDDDDGGWIVEFLISGGEGETQSVEEVGNLEASPWSWGDGESGDGTAAVEVGNDKTEKARCDSAVSLPGDDAYQTGSQTLMAWGPEADEKSSSGEVTMSGLATLDDRIAATIQAFWAVVNDISGPPAQLQQRLTSSGPPSSDYRSQHPQNDFTDGLANASSSSQSTPNHSETSTTLSSSNSTRALCDRYRAALQRLKGTDASEFYSEWLAVSRLEVRAFEGPEGRCVPEPVVLRR